MFDLAGSLCRTARNLRLKGLKYMGAFNAIDLSSLAPPKIIEELSAEKIVDEYVRYFQELVAVGKSTATDERNKETYEEMEGLLPSDPAMKIFEACAYRELLLRQRINEAAKAVMVAYAQGSDLDNLAALVPLYRKETPNGKENDDDFRRRVQLAPEGFSTAGPEGAYIFHALSVEGVKDACPISPEPAEVKLYILSDEPYDEDALDVKNDEGFSTKPAGKGLPSDALVEKLRKKFNEDIRPFTEKLTICPAVIKTYTVEAVLHLKPGPSEKDILEEAKRNLNAYIEKSYALGVSIARSGISAALHLDTVDRVEIKHPEADMVNAGNVAAYCLGDPDITTKVEDA